jgi:hypothetical protein
MTLLTAFKISGVCLGALAAEAVLAYYLFSNYAYELAEQGQYGVREAYVGGPMGTMATVFYVVFVVTIGIGLGVPLVVGLVAAFRRLGARRA